MVARLTEEFMRAFKWFEITEELGPLLALFDDDGEAVNLGRAEPAQGLDQVDTFWRSHRSLFGKIRSEFTHVIEGTGGAVLEWVSRGVLSSGKTVEYNGVTVLETDGARIRRCRIYHDSAVFGAGRGREG